MCNILNQCIIRTYITQWHIKIKCQYTLSQLGSSFRVAEVVTNKVVVSFKELN